MNNALEGLRVLDLTNALAGASATKFLADLGADVIKVERPGDGDFTRAQRPYVFATFNRNKRSVVLDLKQPKASAVVRGLAENSDVFVQSMRPGVVERLGLGREDLTATNPRLIYASFSAFG